MHLFWPVPGLSLSLEGGLLSSGLPTAASQDQDHSTMAVVTHLPDRVFETVGCGWLSMVGPQGLKGDGLSAATLQVCM